MKEINLIRHAQTDYNKKGIIQGSEVDSEIDEEGIKQSKLFYDYYKNYNFEKIYISNLKRTFLTVKEFINDGVVYNPILNEFYWASLGQGSWCNNKRLRVSKRHDLTNCLIGTGIPFGNRVYKNFYKELDNMSKNSAGVRRLGAAALDLAYVASGKIDGFWERDLNLWDISSGVLLVKEAGGKITEPDGKKWTTNSRDIVVSNSLIHKKLTENLTLL